MPFSHLIPISTVTHIEGFIQTVQHWTNKNGSIQLIICDFDLDAYNFDLYAMHQIDFPYNLSRSVQKRQAEFLAGRIAARQAFLKAGLKSGKIPNISVGIHREPIWPEGFAGSITHNGTRAICVLSSNTKETLLGIDIESILPESTATEIAYQIHSDKELEVLVSGGIRPNVATTLIFSAKESLFKALYPTVRTYFGFECAKVSALDIENTAINIILTDEFYLSKKVARDYLINYVIDETNVLTLLDCHT